MPSEPVILAPELATAMVRGDEGALRELATDGPASRRDRFLVLHHIYDLHRAPLHEVGERARWQHHPAVAELKLCLEAVWIDELDRQLDGITQQHDAAEAMRRLADRDQAAAVHRWLAEEATWRSALHFLALDGGPDDVLDDLVATCQVGLPLGPAKLELAHSYWDEMGDGDVEHVRNVLYRRFVEAVDLPVIPLREQPTEALERSALLGLVATNRALQPEMVGALALVELEAGPHCRCIDLGLERLGAPERARAFYRMHAEVDPVHAKGWLDNAVGPLVERFPEWRPRILKGAAWKSAVDAAFFDWAERTLPTAAT